MFARILPRSCNRLGVFLSYSHEQRGQAEEIAQALKNAGHDVFFDRESIPASGDYNDRIRTAIEGADRFVFLASKSSLAPGKFTLTELQMAKERWPVPEGRVLPVLLGDDVSIGDLPVYLRSISVLDVEGNATAEVVHAIQRTRKVGPFCKAVTAAASLALVAGGAFLATGSLGTAPRTDIAMLPVDVVHFRSVADAPFPADAPGASTAWADTPVTITFAPIAYAHRTEPGRRARILAEKAELHFQGKVHPFKAVYVVEITDQRCGDKWFCIKSNAGLETLDPGKTISRETMFFGDGGAAPLWREIVDQILERPEVPMKVVLRSRIDLGSGDQAPSERAVECVVDTNGLRDGMLQQGFKLQSRLKPVYLQSACTTIGIKR